MTSRERQANWRSELVNDLILAHRRVPRSLSDDQYLKDGINFQREVRKCREAAVPTSSMITVERKWPHMMSAYNMATEPSMERFFVEALIMADVPIKQIAEKTGFTVKTLKIFEAMYFDVRKHLDKPVFIMSTVLGPLFDYSSKAHHDHLWKAVAYFCGIEALESLWSLGQTSQESSEKLTNVLRSRLLTEATTAAFSRKPGASNSGFILESFIGNGHLEIAKTTAEAGNDLIATTDDYLSTVQGVVLDNMKLALRPPETKVTSVEGSLSVNGGDPETDGFSRPTAFGGDEEPTKVIKDKDEEQ